MCDLVVEKHVRLSKLKRIHYEIAFWNFKLSLNALGPANMVEKHYSRTHKKESKTHKPSIGLPPLKTIKQASRWLVRLKIQSVQSEWDKRLALKYVNTKLATRNHFSHLGRIVSCMHGLQGLGRRLHVHWHWLPVPDRHGANSAEKHLVVWCTHQFDPHLYTLQSSSSPMKKRITSAIISTVTLTPSTQTTDVSKLTLPEVPLVENVPGNVLYNCFSYLP